MGYLNYRMNNSITLWSRHRDTEKRSQETDNGEWPPCTLGDIFFPKDWIDKESFRTVLLVLSNIDNEYYFLLIMSF